MSVSRRTPNRHHRISAAARRTRQGASRPRHNANGLKEALQAGAGKIKYAVDEAAGDVWESLNGMRTEATDHVRTGLKDLRDRAAGYVEDGQSQAQGLEARIERKIRAQPVTSILIAAGIGCLLGAFWSRR